MVWHEEHPVWSKYLCGTAVIVQQTAEPLLAPNRRSDICQQRLYGRDQEDVSFPLVIAFLCDSAPEIPSPLVVMKLCLPHGTVDDFVAAQSLRVQ